MLEATMTTTSRWDLQGDPLPPLDWRWTGKHWVRQNDESISDESMEA